MVSITQHQRIDEKQKQCKKILLNISGIRWEIILSSI